MWIRIADELPEAIEDEDGNVNCVLVYKKDGFECGSDTQVANTVWVRKHADWCTHWQPLPEPPEVA